MTTILLNLRGLKCPLPALRVRKALKGAAAGTLFVVECTDPMAAIDLPNLMRETGDAIEDSRSEDGLLVFHIRKELNVPDTHSPHPEELRSSVSKDAPDASGASWSILRDAA